MNKFLVLVMVVFGIVFCTISGGIAATPTSPAPNIANDAQTSTPAKEDIGEKSAGDKGDKTSGNPLDELPNIPEEDRANYIRDRANDDILNALHNLQNNKK